MSDHCKRRNAISGPLASRLIEMIESQAFQMLTYIQWPGLKRPVGKSKDGSSSEAGLPAWAELSAAGLRTLDVPAEVLDVHILADGDDAGEAAARDAALRWKHEEHRVLIARPPQGTDFKDLPMGRARPNGRRAA
jgi:hypothetical protein